MRQDKKPHLSVFLVLPERPPLPFPSTVDETEFLQHDAEEEEDSENHEFLQGQNEEDDVIQEEEDSQNEDVDSPEFAEVT